MRFEITVHDDHGNVYPPQAADLATVREHLAQAADTGRRPTIRPHHQDGQWTTTPAEEHQL